MREFPISGVMKPIALTLAMVLALVGCAGSGGRSSEPVQLLTGLSTLIRGGGCFTNWAEGPLVIDPTYGTAIIDTDVHSSTPVTVAWRPGYTARRVGSEVQVLDPDGKVVAITGRRYRIAGGYQNGDQFEPQLPVGVFWACDFVNPQL